MGTIVIAWMLGAFAVLGFPGLAYSAQVASQQVNIVELRKLSLGAEIDKTRGQQCSALDEAARGNASAQLLAATLRQDLLRPGGLLDQYRAISSMEYRLFTCDEIKIITASK